MLTISEEHLRALEKEKNCFSSQILLNFGRSQMVQIKKYNILKLLMNCYWEVLLLRLGKGEERMAESKLDRSKQLHTSTYFHGLLWMKWGGGVCTSNLLTTVLLHIRNLLRSSSLHHSICIYTVFQFGMLKLTNNFLNKLLPGNLIGYFHKNLLFLKMCKR